MHLLNQWPHVRYLKSYLYALAVRPCPAWWLPSGLALNWQQSIVILQDPSVFCRAQTDELTRSMVETTILASLTS